MTGMSCISRSSLLKAWKNPGRGIISCYLTSTSITSLCRYTLLYCTLERVPPCSPEYTIRFLGQAHPAQHKKLGTYFRSTTMKQHQRL